MALLSLTPSISSTVYLYLYITEWRKNAKKYFDPLRSKSEKKVVFHKLLEKKAQFLLCYHKDRYVIVISYFVIDFVLSYSQNSDGEISTQFMTLTTLIVDSLPIPIFSIVLQTQQTQQVLRTGQIRYVVLRKNLRKKNSARLDRKSLGHVVFRHLNDQSSNGS